MVKKTGKVRSVVKKGQKAVSKNSSSTGYDAGDITVLEGLEPVRKRPGMYIGSTGPDGLHHLLVEVFDNARDEAMAGYGGDIEIALLPHGQVRVADNGRGIPVGRHPQTKVSALETVMTTLHAGGKFGNKGYAVTGGLHGVGVSVVNALSKYLKTVVHRDGGVFAQEYNIGKPRAAVRRVGSSERTGTIVTYEPDPEVFKEIKYDWNRVVAHMRQQAYLVRGMKVSILDVREYQDKLDHDNVFYLREAAIDVPRAAYYFEGGLESLVRFTNRYQKAVHRNVFHIIREARDQGVEEVEVALQYVDDISGRIMAFANNTYNPEGGMHLTGFKTALTRTLNTYARANNLLKEKDENFTGDDVLEGITAVVSVKMREIQFEGQTKGKLGSVEARGAVESIFGVFFSAFLEEHPDDARSIIGKVSLAMRARKAAKAAKDSVLRKGALEGMTLPGKLADCQSKDRDESELFIVEGDSAGGCFSGDTKVALADGRDISFKDLVKEHEQGQRNYCYTKKPDGSVAVALIEHPRVTRADADVVKIILDNDQEIVCTPEHKFMLRDGSYKLASDLYQSDSLMPLYRKHSKIGGRITINGYEMVYDSTKKYWIFTHLLSDRYNLDNGVYERIVGDVIHHMDFNKLNNSPDNLVPLDKQAHLIVHTQNLDKTIHRPDVKAKSAEAKRSPEFREQARRKSLINRKIFSANAKKQWQNEEYKAYMLEKFLQFYNSNSEYRRKNNESLNEAQRQYWGLQENRRAQAERVRANFKANPQRRAWLSNRAKEQWSDRELLQWRRERTKTQWNDEFREQRTATYNQTYLNKALTALNTIYKECGAINYERYNKLRKERGDRSIIRHDTICDRFFDGDMARMEEAVMRYNHRIKKIEIVTERMDVYDLEVKDTHNFALASGVFVHNSAKMARDRRTQAILPLFGKVLNAERARLDRVLASDKFRALVIAMGTGVADEFNIEKLRYNRLIIMADADVDGSHIKTLYLTFFYRYFNDVIDKGHVFIAVPPLYKITRGRESAYVYTDEEKNAYLKNIGVNMEEVIEGEPDTEQEEGSRETEDQEETSARIKKTPRVNVQRYKGLGEMSADELWETTMDPARRKLKQVTIADATEADKVFDILMGTDVPARKSFIQSNAKLANLDI